MLVYDYSERRYLIFYLLNILLCIDPSLVYMIFVHLCLIELIANKKISFYIIFFMLKIYFNNLCIYVLFVC